MVDIITSCKHQDSEKIVYSVHLEPAAMVQVRLDTWHVAWPT